MSDRAEIRRYTRRAALQRGGLALGALGLAPLLGGAASLPDGGGDAARTEPSPAPPSRPVADVSRVALVRTDDRVRGTRRAIELLGPEGAAGQTVLLKPNLNTGGPAPAATDAALLEALVLELRNAGARRITIGDRSGMAVTREAMEMKGVYQLAERHELDVVAFDEMDRDGWHLFGPEGTHWERGFAMPRAVLDAGAVVNTCCLKTHRFGGHFTLSLKNTIGMVAKYVPGDEYNYMTELHASEHQRLMIAEANRAYDPALVLLDGVQALTDGGPDTGTLASPGIILAGTDRVAVDAVGVAILRSLGTTEEVSRGSIWDLEQIRRAVELGLGAASPEQIELVTADAASEKAADEVRRMLA